MNIEKMTIQEIRSTYIRLKLEFDDLMNLSERLNLTKEADSLTNARDVEIKAKHKYGIQLEELKNKLLQHGIDPEMLLD